MRCTCRTANIAIVAVIFGFLNFSLTLVTFKTVD